MTLARYYLGLLGRNFLLALGVSAALFFIIDSMESSKMLMGAQVPPGVIAALFWAKLQVMVLQITPLALLLSVVLTLGTLELRSEIVAAQAGGINPARFMGYTALLALPVVAALFYMEERVVPRASALVDEITTARLGRYTSTWTYFYKERNWFRGPSGHLFRVGRVDAARGALADLLILKVEDSGMLSRRIEARTAVIRGDGQWELGGATVMTFGPGGRATAEALEQVRLPFSETIGDFRVIKGRPQQMTLKELDDLISYRQGRGIDVRKYLFERYAKVSFPFSALFVAIAGAACLYFFRGGVSIVRYVAFATAICFVYWVVYSLGISLSEARMLHPAAAAWLPNAAMALVAGAAALKRHVSPSRLT